MKRILLFVIMLMMITVSAFANKQEWIDKNYDFGKAKNILIMFYVPDELKNGITETIQSNSTKGQLDVTPAT